MAEMMMKHLIEEKNLSDQITVASRSTSTYEIGNSPHPGAIAELKIKNPNY
jgi:Protein-tyrosine-phosphatase